MKDIEDEIPFEVPEGWAWCRLNELCTTPIIDGTHQTPTYSDKENGIPFLSSKDVTSGKIDWSKIKYITKSLHEELYKRVAPQINDILLAKNGTTGIAAIVEDDIIFDIYVTLAVIRPNLNLCNPHFLLNLVNSDFCKSQFNSHLTGIGVPNLHLVDIKKTLIPLPPIEEQKEINDTLKVYLEKIEILNINKADLQTAIKHAKSKILDLAIHGKLVPQDPSEEPAGKLLERIRAEKEAKIAAGELKRDKNDSYIYRNSSDNCHYRKYANGQEECIESEIVFSLPDSWQWVNLGGVFSHNTGKALNKSKLEGEYKDYITTSNVYWDKFELNNVSKMPFTPEEMKKCTVTKGDLLICEGGDVGRSNIWDKDYDICIQNHLHRLRAFVPVETKLFYFWLMLFKQRNMIVGKGIGLMGFSSSLVHNLLIPLPPLSEQKRIVAKIEEIFSCLENIENNIT